MKVNIIFQDYLEDVELNVIPEDYKNNLNKAIAKIEEMGHFDCQVVGVYGAEDDEIFYES